jgi:hypothetical protein
VDRARRAIPGQPLSSRKLGAPGERACDFNLNWN